MESKSPFEGLTIAKIFWGVLAITGVGAVAIMMQHSNRQVTSDQFMLTTKLLAENGRNTCGEALYKHFGTDPGLPNDNVSDGDTRVTLKWRATDGPYRSIDCTYVLDQGVVALTVDGKAIAAK